MNNAEHTLFFCARWGVAREAVGRKVGAQLTPDTMVSFMLQSERKWMLIESFVTLVMKMRELDGSVERMTVPRVVFWFERGGFGFNTTKPKKKKKKMPSFPLICRAVT